MPVSQFDLAVIGADSPLGETLLRMLDERELAIGRLLPLSMEPEPESTVSFQGEDWPCMPADEFDFTRVQALVVADPSPAAQKMARELAERFPAKPMVSCAAIDPAVALAVARVLKPLATSCAVNSASAFATLPVSLAGRAGVEELATQSLALFNMETPETAAFPLQIAFNLIPRLHEPEDYAEHLRDATGRLAPGCDVLYSVAWAPLFHGVALALHVHLAEGPGLDAIKAILARVPGLVLMETGEPAGVPTPATDAFDSDAVCLGGLRLTGRRMSLWMVFDPARLEAERLVSVVENWIDMPANSVLT